MVVFPRQSRKCFLSPVSLLHTDPSNYPPASILVLSAASGTPFRLLSEDFPSSPDHNITSCDIVVATEHYRVSKAL